MADFPLIGDGQVYESVGAATGTSTGTTITASGSTHTKGSWTELIASTGAHAGWIYITMGDESAEEYLVDIGIGGSGSEVVLIPNLADAVRTAYGQYAYMFPVDIPAGSRLSARCQCLTGSATIKVAALIASSGFLPSAPLGIVTDLGANTADSGGTSVDCGGSANTKGAYSQLVASTTYPISFLSFSLGNGSNTGRTSAGFLIDVAVGGAGSEQIVIPNIYAWADGPRNQMLPHTTPLYPVAIPAGSRIAVRAQTTTTDATDRLFDITGYGVS